MLGGGVEDVKSGGVEGVLKLVAERISNRLTLYQTIESIGLSCLFHLSYI